MKKENIKWSVKPLKIFGLLMLVWGTSNQTFAQFPADAKTSNLTNEIYSKNKENHLSVSDKNNRPSVKIAGLSITPVGETRTVGIVQQKNIQLIFRVTNTGNFKDKVKFLDLGASLVINGPGTITSAKVGGTDIFTNYYDVLKSLKPNGYVDVLVTLDLKPDAVVGSVIQIYLGDAITKPNSENVAADNSYHEVSTISKNASNGSREARGDITLKIVKDNLPQVTYTQPKEPVSVNLTTPFANLVDNGGAK